jgi:hypothetical protein
MKCRDCPAPAAPNRTRCKRCAILANGSTRDRVAAKLAAGLCRNCTRPKKAEHSYCVECLEKHSAKSKQLAEMRKAVGHCYRCGKGSGEFRACGKCREKDAERQRLR